MIRGRKSSKYYDHLRRHEWSCVASFGPGSQTRYRIILGLLKKHYAEPPILDVGCGIGEMVNKLSKIYPQKQIMGTDFSAESVKICRSKYPNLIFSQYDILNFPRNNSKRYNTVICSEVLEHLSDVSLAINNLKTLLNKNGLLIISVPYQMKFWSSHDKFSGHFRRFEKGELQNILTEQKFEIIDNFSYGRFVYRFYYFLLKFYNPKKIMPTSDSSKANIIFKIFISRLLWFIFLFEDLFYDYSCDRGQRLYLVARKITK